MPNWKVGATLFWWGGAACGAEFRAFGVALVPKVKPEAALAGLAVESVDSAAGVAPNLKTGFSVDCSGADVGLSEGADAPAPNWNVAGCCWLEMISGVTCCSQDHLAITQSLHYLT